MPAEKTRSPAPVSTTAQVSSSRSSSSNVAASASAVSRSIEFARSGRSITTTLTRPCCHPETGIAASVPAHGPCRKIEIGCAYRPRYCVAARRAKPVLPRALDEHVDERAGGLGELGAGHVGPDAPADRRVDAAHVLGELGRDVLDRHERRADAGGGQSRRDLHLRGAHRPLGLEAGGAAGQQRLLAEPVPLLVEHPLAPGERLEREVVAGLRERVAERHDEDQLLPAELDPRAAPLGRQRPDAEVGAPVLDRLRDQGAAGELEQADRDVGLQLAPALDRRGQHRRRERADRRHREQLGRRAEGAPARGQRTVRRRHGGAGVADQRLARRRQPDVARRAVEQRPADLRLERPDLLRQRGLRDVQPRRRLGERPGLRDREQVLQLPQRHRSRLYPHERRPDPRLRRPMDDAPLLVDHPRDGVARLLLNRPERHNALDRALVDALHDRGRGGARARDRAGLGGARAVLRRRRHVARRRRARGGERRALSPLRPHPRAAAPGAGRARRAGDRGRPPARDHLRSPDRRARGAGCRRAGRATGSRSRRGGCRRSWGAAARSTCA